MILSIQGFGEAGLLLQHKTRLYLVQVPEITRVRSHGLHYYRRSFAWFRCNIGLFFAFTYHHTLERVRARGSAMNRCRIVLGHSVCIHVALQELVYQQVLRRFGMFGTIRLSSPANVTEVLQIALDHEEATGNWSEADGSKEEIVKLATELLCSKAPLLQEYFAIQLDGVYG